MKRIGSIALIIMALVFTSCQTTDRESRITREEAESALAVLFADSVERSLLTIQVSADDVSHLFPSSLEPYKSQVTRFDILYRDASDALASLIENAIKSALNELSDYEYTLADPNESLISMDLFSQNRTGIIAYARPFIASYIEENRKEFEEEYSALIFECSVIKANHENLERVGFNQALPEISPFNYNQATRRASEMLYSSLQESEVRLRNTPVSQHDDEIYRYFWEEL